MPTKTYRRVSDQKARPFQPKETELFPMKICGQMARASCKDDLDEIIRLHQILNYPGSFSQVAAYLKKEGIPEARQRAALKHLLKSLTETIKLIDELDWQSNECTAAGYAKEKPVFTASSDRVSSEFYSQRNRDVEAIRRYREAIAFAEAHINTSSKSRVGIEIRQVKYIIEAYEEFTGQLISGERSNKKGNSAREFLELGINHITGGNLTVEQIGYVIREASEMLRKQRTNTCGGNNPSAGG
jgi:hypothetical protein